MKYYPIRLTLTNNEEVAAFARAKTEWYNDDPIHFPKFELYRLSNIINTNSSIYGEYYLDSEYDLILPPNTLINGNCILKVDLYTEFDELRTILEGAQTNEDWLKEKIQHIPKDYQNEK